MCHQCDDEGRSSRLSRRTLLVGAGAAATSAFVPAAWATQPRSLAFYHTHTRERLRLTYAENGTHLPQALEEINHFLRDFRTGDEHPIDVGLLDALHQLRLSVGGNGTFEIISAYRSPKTNEMLRDRSNGVAQKSLHMQGKAMDVRLTGVRIARLREEALALSAGGVGYYPESDFVHVDTGRVRQW